VLLGTAIKRVSIGTGIVELRRDCALCVQIGGTGLAAIRRFRRYHQRHAYTSLCFAASPTFCMTSARRRWWFGSSECGPPGTSLPVCRAPGEAACVLVREMTEPDRRPLPRSPGPQRITRYRPPTGEGVSAVSDAVCQRVIASPTTDAALFDAPVISS
jgi:hypothetical protein